MSERLEPAVYTMTEAARLLGISRTTADRLEKRGEFPVRVIRIGGRVMVPKRPLNEMLGIAA